MNFEIPLPLFKIKHGNGKQPQAYIHENNFEDLLEGVDGKP